MLFQIIWFVLWGVLWSVYFMLDGFVLGTGMRLFGEASDKKSMRLVGNKTVADLAFLTYEPVRDA